MKRIATVLLTLLAISGLPSSCQTPGYGETPTNEERGFRLYSASITSSYYSAGYGAGLRTGPVDLSSDLATGGAATAGWNRVQRSSSMYVVYSLSYTGRIRYSDLNGLNQSLSIKGSRKMGEKWSASVSGAASVSNIEQYLFQPTHLSAIASTPTTFEDLAAGVLTRRSRNPRMAALLTETPVLESPLRTLLYGSRVFSSSLRSSLTYAHSSRTSISTTFTGSRSQHLPDSGTGQETRYPYLLSNSTSGGVGVRLTHSATRRTQWSLEATATRTKSQLLDAYNSTATGTFGRTMGRRWLIQVQGGVGFIQPLWQRYTTIELGPHYVAAGSLAYKRSAHTFLGSYNRSVGDEYGLGASTSTSAIAAWQWSRPGRNWTANSSFGWQQFERSGFVEAVDGWRAEAGIVRRLGSHLALQWRYAYTSYSGIFANVPYDQANTGVQVGLVWFPGREIDRTSAWR